MIRRSWCDGKGDQGSSLVEYSLALVLIGLAAVLVVSFVGRATSDAFDEAGAAFPTDVVASSPDDVPAPDVFSELLSLVGGLSGPGNSLIGKAEDAESSYLEGDLDGARSKLDSLLQEVDAQDGKKLTPQEADAVRDAVQRLVDNLGPG
jgi:Flp pilus assembly pilin Flp